MEVICLPGEMTAWSRDQAAGGRTIALVPTMGFFHEGHLSLMRMARAHADRVIVSLFVNPIQFGPNEDLEAYPRDFERDCRLAGLEGVDVVFAPTGENMYPEGFQTTVSVSAISRHLCGADRPSHFDGVVTVLTKLFHITEADCAVFGEKDFQQLAIIRRMVKDLDTGIEIIGHPIVREPDGLAMSSRNTYLDKTERITALCLYQSLVMTRSNVRTGMLNTKDLAGAVRDHILSFSGTEIDYVEFVDSRSLGSVECVGEKTLLALAVRINDKVRLIDNGLVWQ